MAIYSGGALFGTGLAPLISSMIVYHTSWRWVYYSHAIAAGCLVVLMLLFFKETRGNVILRGKAQALNKYYDQLEEAGHIGVMISDKDEACRIRWKVQSDEQRASLTQMILTSCYRPFSELSFIFPPICMLGFSWSRYARYRTRGFFLLPLDCVQLGSSLPPVCCGSVGLRDQPWL